MTTENRSGHDLDLFGDGTPVTPLYVPDRRRSENGCVLRVDGQCPTDYLACEEFLEEWHQASGSSQQEPELMEASHE